jgi:hypothetical protein
MQRNTASICALAASDSCPASLRVSGCNGHAALAGCGEMSARRGMQIVETGQEVVSVQDACGAWTEASEGKGSRREDGQINEASEIKKW